MIEKKIINCFLIWLQIQADIFPFASFPSLLIETSVQSEKGLSKDQFSDLTLQARYWFCTLLVDHTLLSSTWDVRGGCTMYRQADSLPLSLNLVLGSVTRSTEYIKFWWSKEKNDGSCKMLFHLFACNQWKWVLTIFSLDLNVSCQNWPKLNLYIICRYNICNLYNIY